MNYLFLHDTIKSKLYILPQVKFNWLKLVVGEYSTAGPPERPIFVSTTGRAINQVWKTRTFPYGLGTGATASLPAITFLIY